MGGFRHEHRIGKGRKSRKGQKWRIGAAVWGSIREVYAIVLDCRSKRIGKGRSIEYLIAPQINWPHRQWDESRAVWADENQLRNQPDYD